MGQNRQFISIDSVIKDHMVENDKSNHSYFKLWHLAFRCYEYLGIDFFYQVKSVKLPVLANMTVLLPADYLNYQKIGVFNASGEVIPLKYNDKLTTFQDLQPTRLATTVDNTLFDIYVASSPIFYNYWNGDVFVNLYGLPSGSPQVGSFKIDNTNGVILLSENFGYNYIVVEYISSPVEGQDYYIPIQFREAMIAWLNWKTAKIGTSRWAWRIEQSFEHQWWNQRRLAQARYRPLYLEQAYEQQLEMTRMTLKA